jgi:methenyltetrahydrofolate cyclohydrolase
MGENLPSMSKDPAPKSFPLIAAVAEELAEGDGYPAGGAVAALVAALAGSLAAAAADRSRSEWNEAGGARAQAQALRRRALELAERDAVAYATAREALATRRPDSQLEASVEDQDARDWRLGVAVKQAAGPPLELAASAADIAQLAAGIARFGAEDVRADAVVAAVLGAAAARAAAWLVQVNLVVGDQEPSVLARRYAEAAAAAVVAAEAV